jgi:hypothetical protein
MATKRQTTERVPNYPSLYPEIELLEVDYPEIEVELLDIDYTEIEVEPLEIETLSPWEESLSTYN